MEASTGELDVDEELVEEGTLERESVGIGDIQWNWKIHYG